MGKIWQSNGTKKQVGVTFLISDKTDFECSFSLEVLAIKSLYVSMYSGVTLGTRKTKRHHFCGRLVAAQ